MKKDKKYIDIEKIRKAIADYMYSEGCSCCRGSDHDEHKKIIAELLGVPMYDDESGYDFSKFRSDENT